MITNPKHSTSESFDLRKEGGLTVPTSYLRKTQINWPHNVRALRQPSIPKARLRAYLIGQQRVQSMPQLRAKSRAQPLQIRDLVTLRLSSLATTRVLETVSRGNVPAHDFHAAREGLPTLLRFASPTDLGCRPLSRGLTAASRFAASSFRSHQTMMGVPIAIDE